MFTNINIIIYIQNKNVKKLKYAFILKIEIYYLDIYSRYSKNIIDYRKKVS